MSEASTSRWGEAAFVFVACFGLFTILSAYVLYRGDRTLTYSSVRVAATLAYEIAIGTLVLLWLRHRRGNVRALRPRFQGDTVLVGALLGAGVFGAYLAVCTVTASLFPASAAMGVTQVEGNVNVWLLMAFLVCNSWFEETFVVAYVTDAFETAGAARVLLISTALRTAYHLYQSPAAIAGLVLTGIILAGCYWRMRDLSVLIVAHTTINMIILLPRLT